jgi:hypothetical protein
VVIYANRNKVAANFVLDSGDLTADRSKEIMTSLKRVLP